MVSLQLFAISALRALVEVAGFALLGQGLLYVLAGSSRDRNVVYKLFQIITGPVIRGVRKILPRFIIDRHVPVVSFFIVFWLWIALNVAKRIVCAANGLECV